MIFAKFLIIISALILIIAMLAKWWFWGRCKVTGARMECSLTVAELYERVGVRKKKAGDFRDAASLGDAVRDAGLWLLEKDGMKIAKRRRTGWWNLRILPFLLITIVVFSLITRRIPIHWVIGVGCALIALHVVLRVVGLSVELEAVKRGWQALEKAGGLHRMNEREEIMRCARASAWKTVVPW